MYRNNVVFGLIVALRARFPAVECIVGAECFAAVARLFVSAHPPRSPLMILYGDAFPDFLAGFGPLRELAYLPDVARLESARVQAFHAADAEPIAPAILFDDGRDRLPDTRLRLHPSVHVLRSRFPVVSIWSMNCGEAEPGSIEAFGAEDALILRRGLMVLVRTLPPGGAAFLQALAAGETLGDAARAALADHAGFDLTANLAGLIESAAITALARPSTRRSA